MLETSMLNDLLFDPAYLVLGLIALCVVLLLLNIISLAKIHGLKKKYKTFMQGNEAKSLEELIKDEVLTIAELKSTDEQITKTLTNLNETLKSCFQKAAVVKYDALSMAGKISFALALLNVANDGFVLNSIHTREGSYLYLKEIKNGKCDLTLGKEEQECLQKAIASK